MCHLLGRIHQQVPSHNITLLSEAYQQAVEQVQHNKTHQAKFLWIMSHDWGACYHFVWSVAEWQKWGKSAEQLPIFKGQTVVQSMGDTDTNCYEPRKDIVVPPRTLITQELIARFGDVQRMLGFKQV